MADKERSNAQEFLDMLARSTEEHARVVSQRPTATDLADSMTTIIGLLYEQLDAYRQLAAVERDQSPRATYEWFPRAGSTCVEDFDWLEPFVARFCSKNKPSSLQWLETSPTRNPSSWRIAYLKRCLHTVIDDLSAIGALVTTADHIRAPITLARSALEAAAMGCYLLDDTATPEERLRRTLNLHFQELKESLNSGPVEGYESKDELAIQELTEFAGLFGLQVRYKPHRPYAPVILAEGKFQPDSTRLVLDDVLPDGLGRWMWRSLSAVAHSRASQSLLPDEYTLPHELKDLSRKNRDREVADARNFEGRRGVVEILLDWFYQHAPARQADSRPAP